MRRLTIVRTRLLPLAGAVLALLVMPAIAGEIYTWRDARGVMHYSDSPPPGQKHAIRSISDRGTAIVAAPAAKAAPNSDCSNARSNLTLLQGTGKIGIDDNKDGKPDRELTVAERSRRLKLAQAQIETYCDAPTANAVTTIKQS
ncbi:MAG: DUF4124 domain-containing protein [Lysobacter sp.]|nr:MAG: DUF4124 domain-containing protein [Lysobacter sp.]